MNVRSLPTGRSKSLNMHSESQREWKITSRPRSRTWIEISGQNLFGYRLTAGGHGTRVSFHSQRGGQRKKLKVKDFATAIQHPEDTEKPWLLIRITMISTRSESSLQSNSLKRAALSTERPCRPEVESRHFISNQHYIFFKLRVFVYSRLRSCALRRARRGSWCNSKDCEPQMMK